MCEICDSLRAMHFNAELKGDTDKMHTIEGWQQRHEAEHQQQQIEIAYKAAMAARVEGDTLARPDQRRW